MNSISSSDVCLLCKSGPDSDGWRQLGASVEIFGSKAHGRYWVCRTCRQQLLYRLGLMTSDKAAKETEKPQ